MGTPAAKMEPEPRLRARVRVRAKGQLTLPEEICRTLHVGEGDEVEFAVHDDGTVSLRGYVSIPTDQAWFFTPEWLAGEREPTRTSQPGTAPSTSPPRICSIIWIRSGQRMSDADLRDTPPVRVGLEETRRTAAGDLPRGRDRVLVPDLAAPDRPFRPGCTSKA
jgi:AbrB family looped-hinge helix DNA binding protein